MASSDWLIVSLRRKRSRHRPSRRRLLGPDAPASFRRRQRAGARGDLPAFDPPQAELPLLSGFDQYYAHRAAGAARRKAREVGVCLLVCFSFMYLCLACYCEACLSLVRYVWEWRRYTTHYHLKQRMNSANRCRWARAVSKEMQKSWVAGGAASTALVEEVAVIKS